MHTTYIRLKYDIYLRCEAVVAAVRQQKDRLLRRRIRDDTLNAGLQAAPNVRLLLPWLTWAGQRLKVTCVRRRDHSRATVVHQIDAEDGDDGDENGELKL